MPQEGQYTKIGGAYFQQSPGGLSAVSDPGILNQLKSGAISAQEQGVGAIAGPNLTPVTPYAAPSLPPKITSEVLNPAPLPPIPTPTAPTQQAAYFDSVTQQAESAKKSLEEERKRQLEDTQRQRQESEKKQTELAARQAEILGEVKGITTPFREDLETKERERLYINENFEANQKLTRELDSLLSEGNALIEQERSRPVATAIQSRLVSQTMEKVAARAGVIQAVMAARSGQIGEAERLIDRSVNAINADRNDQLTYYNALMSFYETAKTDEGKRITELTKEEKSFFQSTIKDLENEVKRTQDYADMIKKAMVDPDTALLYANAGVTLSDSPSVIAQKIAKQIEINIANGLNAKGTAKATTTSLNAMTDNERGLLTTFKNEQIVKDYNSILAKKLSVDLIIKAGIGGPGDLALVYEFMKGLDPTSVVRESEYAAAAKSGNIFLGVLARFNGFFKETGGFMPPATAKAFQDIVSAKFDVQSKLYENVASSYRDIAERQGLDPNNVVPRYSDVAPTGPPLSELPPTDEKIGTKSGIGEDSGFWGGLLNLYQTK